MEKLLAALNLPQVGEIRLVDPDDESYEEENDGSLFTIELNDRIYTMKVIHFTFSCVVFLVGYSPTDRRPRLWLLSLLLSLL